jgi:hypothetical protein
LLGAARRGIRNETRISGRAVTTGNGSPFARETLQAVEVVRARSGGDERRRRGERR